MFCHRIGSKEKGIRELNCTDSSLSESPEGDEVVILARRRFAQSDADAIHVARLSNLTRR